MCRLKYIYVLLIMLLAVSGCNTMTIEPNVMNNAIDKTIGNKRLTQSKSLLLVTMSNSDHDLVVQDESVSQNELPVLYAQLMAGFSKKYAIKRVADWPLQSLGIRCLVFEADSTQHRNKVIAALQSEPTVESAQALRFFSSMTAFDQEAEKEHSHNTNDKNLNNIDSQHSNSHYNDPYVGLQYSLSSMQVEASHQWSTGQGVSIAVIDTGLDTRHNDLRGQIAGIKNFVDRDTGQYQKDVHGTAVSAIIAATANNQEGIVGIAPEADILGIKACWQNNETDTKARCNSFTLAKSLDFAISQRVDIINMSLAGPRDPLLERLVQKAIENQITVIGAVNPLSQDEFPAAVPGVIAVSTVVVKNNQKQTKYKDNVFAPGKKVFSAHPDNKYDFYSGSSLATAHISGLTALIKQRKPHLSAGIIKRLLRDTEHHEQGVNACEALSKIINDAKCPQINTL